MAIFLICNVLSDAKKYKSVEYFSENPSHLLFVAGLALIVGVLAWLYNTQTAEKRLKHLMFWWSLSNLFLVWFIVTIVDGMIFIWHEISSNTSPGIDPGTREVLSQGAYGLIIPSIILALSLYFQIRKLKKSR
jgi:uncharacterized membrane protein